MCQVMVHDEHNSHRRPISCSVAGIDRILDVVALKVQGVVVGGLGWQS